MMYVNIDGWTIDKMQDLIDICKRNDDILTITLSEMKLPEGTQENLRLQGYTHHPLLRADGTGGLCTWIKTTVSESIQIFQPFNDDMKYDTERTWTVFDLEHERYAVCSIYMRTESQIDSEKYRDNVELLQQIQKEAEEFKDTGRRIMIWGDMNGHVKPNQRFQFKTYTQHKQNNNGKLIENLSETLDLYCINPLAQNPDDLPMYTYQRNMGNAFHQSIIDYSLVDTEFYTNIENFTIDTSGEYALNTDHATLMIEMNGKCSMDSETSNKQPPLKVHDKVIYKEEIENLSKQMMDKFQDFSVDRQNDMITEAIMKAAQNQPQKTDVHQTARRENRIEYKTRMNLKLKTKKLKKLRRQGHTDTNLLEKQINKLKKQQTKLQWKSKYTRRNRLIKKMKENTPEVSRLFWKTLHPKNKDNTYIKMLKDGPTEYKTASDKGRVIEHYFERKFNASRFINDHNLEEEITGIKDPTNKLSESDKRYLASLFKMEDLEEVISELKEGKAAGTDRITPTMLKHVGQYCKELILQLYNNIWRSGTVPESWKEADVVLILKRPPATEIDMYRPIMLISTLCKLLTKMIAKRVGTVIERSMILNDNQNGFRKDRRTTDNIFILQTLQEQQKNNGDKLFCLYVDIKSAYDSVSRPILYHKLEQFNFPTELTSFLKNYYTGDNITSMCGGQKTNPMYLTRGVRQGCNLSSYLFLIYLTELGERIEKEQIGPVMVDTQIGMLSFADDLVMLARTEKEVTQHLEILSNWCKDFKMSVSPTKTQMIAPDTKELWILTTDGLDDDTLLEIKKSYNYLGINQHQSVARTLSELSSECLRKAEQFRSLINMQRYTVIDSVNAYKILWENVFLPSILYALDVIPISVSTIEKLDKIQIRVGRSILGVRSSTPSAVVNIELGFKSLLHKILKARLTYIQRLSNRPEGSILHNVYKYHKSNNDSKFWQSTKEMLQRVDILEDNITLVEPRTIDEQMVKIIKNEIYSKQTLELVLPPKKWWSIREGVFNREWSRVFLQFKYMNAGLGNRDTYYKNAAHIATQDGQVFVCPLCQKGRNDEVHIIDQCSMLEEFRVRTKYNANKTLRQLLQSLRTSNHHDSLSVVKRFFGAGRDLSWKDIRRKGEILERLRDEYFLKWAETLN